MSILSVNHSNPGQNIQHPFTCHFAQPLKCVLTNLVSSGFSMPLQTWTRCYWNTQNTMNLMNHWPTKTLLRWEKFKNFVFMKWNVKPLIRDFVGCNLLWHIVAPPPPFHPSFCFSLPYFAPGLCLVVIQADQTTPWWSFNSWKSSPDIPNVQLAKKQ